MSSSEGAMSINTVKMRTDADKTRSQTNDSENLINTVAAKPVTYRHYLRKQSKKQQKFEKQQKSKQQAQAKPRNNYITDNSSECSARSSYSADKRSSYSDLNSESAAQKYLIDQKNNLLGLKPSNLPPNFVSSLNQISDLKINSNLLASNLGLLKTESNDSGVTHPDSVTSSGFSSYRKINNQIPAPTTNYFSVMQKNKQNTDYIGFGHLPNQIFAKLIKKGFDFNVMIVGESGLGKSTLVNSLFLSDIYNSSFPGPSFRMEQTVKVEKHEVLLEEKGVKLRLGVIDTPGFGDHVDNSESWEPIEEYIENQYSRYLAAESRLKRKPHFKDSRVHCCLYFVPPRVHGLRQIDLTFMKRLHEQVVIVPVIAKSDSLTPEERKTMKARIRNQLEEAQIHVYYFPDCQETPLALDTSEYTSETKFSVDISHQPFNVIGSNCVMDGRLRARKYPWGIVDIENEEHSDLKMLRQCLMQTNMYNLIDTTNTIFYERYRRSRLEKRFENVEADVHATAYSAFEK